MSEQMTQMDLNFIMPLEVGDVQSLVGVFNLEETLFEGKRSASANSVICRKMLGTIEIVLSDVRAENYLGRGECIRAVGICARSPLGKLLSYEESGAGYGEPPYALTHITIDLGGTQCLNYECGEDLTLTVNLVKEKFDDFCSLLKQDLHSTLIVDAELWCPPDQKARYMRLGNRKITGLVDLIVDERNAALRFTYDELCGALICRNVGEKINLDARADSAAQALKRTGFFKLIVIVLEVLAGLLFIYFNMHG